MIQRLITSLQALAAPAEIQLQRFPDFVVKADELALDYNDAFMPIRDYPQLELTSEQVAALTAVDEALYRMSGPARESVWTESALRDSAEWEHVRGLAVIALKALGATVTPPAPSDAVYVGPG